MCMYKKHENICFHYQEEEKQYNTSDSSSHEGVTTQKKMTIPPSPPLPKKRERPSKPYAALVIDLIDALVLKVSSLCFHIQHTIVRLNFILDQWSKSWINEPKAVDSKVGSLIQKLDQ